MPDGFNAMLFGAELLFVPMAVGIYAIVSGDSMRRLIAAQFVATIAAAQLVLLAIAFGTAQFADLGITFALLSTAATLAYARFLERWL